MAVLGAGEVFNLYSLHFSGAGDAEEAGEVFIYTQHVYEFH